MKGMFIVLEAVKSAEKLKQAVRLYRWLKSEGYEAVLTTQYWTEGRVGRNMEALLDGVENPVMEALLFAADRAEHIEKLIRPALESGKIVVCDRYYHSSIAFQSASGLDESWIREINRHFIKPDIAFYIDSNPEEAGEKKKIRTVNDSDIQKRAGEMYSKMAENGELIRILADGNSDETFSMIKKIVSEKLSSTA
ncbi:MAG: dTMP kinase [Candidatus Aenigmatarchaeota archaeon]